MHSRGAGRGVTYSGGHLRVLVSDADFGADAVAVAPRAAQANDQPVTRVGAYVFPKFRGRAQRRDHRIHAAVAVEIGEGGAAMGLHQGEAGFGRYILEYATRIGEHAVGFLVHGRFERLDTVIHVRVGGEEVLPAIVVEI